MSVLQNCQQSITFLLFTMFPVMTEYITRGMQLIFQGQNSKYFFKRTLILSTITELNKLDQDIHSAESYALFQKQLLSFVRPEANNIFNVHKVKGIKLFLLLVGFTHLKEKIAV